MFLSICRKIVFDKIKKYLPSFSRLDKSQLTIFNCIIEKIQGGKSTAYSLKCKCENNYYITSEHINLAKPKISL